MSARLERFAEALTWDWHDATCPEGKGCGSRWLHSRGLSWPATLAKVVEQGALIAVADAELATQDQSWSQFHTDTTRALETAEAEVERLRALVDSAEQKAADYHDEILAAHAERDKLRRQLAGMREETRTLADGMGGSVWSDGKLVQSITKPNTIQRRLVTEWTSE